VQSVGHEARVLHIVGLGVDDAGDQRPVRPCGMTRL
jgi:hypothetical protein